MTNKIRHGVSAYTNWGCRCDTCRTAWREDARRRRNSPPSPMSDTIDRLQQELETLQEENAALRCRINELETGIEDLPGDDEIVASFIPKWPPHT